APARARGRRNGAGPPGERGAGATLPRRIRGARPPGRPRRRGAQAAAPARRGPVPRPARGPRAGRPRRGAGGQTGGRRAPRRPALNLALRQPRYENRDALVAAFDGKVLGLLLEQAGEHSVALDWTARGDPGPDGLHFDLRVPPCAVSSLELNLPADRAVTVP